MMDAVTVEEGDLMWRASIFQVVEEDGDGRRRFAPRRVDV
jgi:hypothetical protein